MLASRIVAIFVTLPALAAAHGVALFEGSDPIDATLEGPLGELMDRPDEREQLPFAFRADGKEHAIRVRLRGKSRLRLCEFMPLRLNFRKDETDGTLFAEQDKLKLVVPCHDSERAEKNLVEEYAAYRIFNLLTPASYRVRMLHMTFTDPERGDETRLHSFVLESSGQLAARLGGRESGRPEVSLAWFDSRHMALVYVFQYLIGNTDWSLVRADGEEACCHNGTLVETGETLLYVPYDFDLSGLVDAPYAYPPPDLRISRVTERRYRGFCTDTLALQAALDTVVARREEMIDLIRSLPVLSDKDKDRRIGYLDQFFRAARNRDRLLGRFEARCLD